MYCAQILSLCSACAHYGNRDRAQTFFLNNQLEVVPLKLRDFPPSPLDTSRLPPPTVPPSVLHDYSLHWRSYWKKWQRMLWFFLFPDPGNNSYSSDTELW